jgi:hypothetical protein
VGRIAWSTIRPSVVVVSMLYQSMILIRPCSVSMLHRGLDAGLDWAFK